MTWFFGLLVAGYAIGVGVREWVPIGPGSRERAVVAWFVERRTARLTDVVRALQFIGTSEFLVLLIAIAAVWVVFGGGHRAWFAVWLGVGAEAFVDVLKPLVDRPRPPVRWRLEDTPSGAFPSGHALVAATIVFGVVLIAWRGRGRSTPWWAWGAAAVVAGLGGLSRVYLGVHWITDVIGGSVLAVTWALALASVMFDPPVAATGPPGAALRAEFPDPAVTG